MTTDLIVVHGLPEVQAMLKEAPRTVVASGFLRSLEAAASVIEAEVLALTPISHSNVWNDETFSFFRAATGGELRAALTHETVLDSNFRGGRTAVGFGKWGHVALWVEYGHRMVGHKSGGYRALGFVPAHPFMRPAFDISGDKAIAVFADTLAGTLKGIYG